MGWRKQDRQTQKLFDNVTKSLRGRDDGIVRDDNGRIVAEVPLKEEHPIGSLLLLRGAGPATAKGLEWVGEKMMPSALLKGIGQTFPKVAKAATAISPYADAGLLATWGAQGIREAKEAVKSGDAAGAIAGASMAALPLMGINPEVAQELTATQKANKVARALNKEVKPLSRPITEFERNGKYTLDELHQMGYKLPRKHLQGEDAVKMFKEYGTAEIPENSQIIEQLRKYVPEARERYGLVRNTNITDDEIAGSLYKKALELGGNTAARNEVGEPLVLFRGDTKRFPALRKVAEPESLAKGTGSMDNSFGNLFLGQLGGPGEGVERYIHYVHQYPGGATTVFPSATGERIIWNGNKIRQQGADINIPEKYLSYDISEPFNMYGQQIRRRKISSELAKPNSNDINAFVVRTPSIRNASSEISPEMGGEFIDINGVPKFKNSPYVDRNQSATRIRQILTDAESKGQGLLKSDAYSPLRENEHFEFDYYALPNFNIRNAKHLLPYDFRIKPQWGSRLIYRKQGGILKAQKGTPNNGLPPWIKRDDSTRTYITAFKPGIKTVEHCFVIDNEVMENN